MQDKQHEFMLLTDAFDRAVTLVNNRLGLAKVGDNTKFGELEKGKAKWSVNKRKASKGQAVKDQESRKAPFNGNKPKIGKKPTQAP